ncbi:hypothetical protein D3C87_1180190 [compost metagenome]
MPLSTSEKRLSMTKISAAGSAGSMSSGNIVPSGAGVTGGPVAVMAIDTLLVTSNPCRRPASGTSTTYRPGVSGKVMAGCAVIASARGGMPDHSRSGLPAASSGRVSVTV